MRRTVTGAVLFLAVAGLGLAGCISPPAPAANEPFSPGLWRTQGGPSCYWERVRGDGSIIDNDFSTGGPRYAYIGGNDAGFHTRGCITFWRDTPPGINPVPLATPGQPFGDGDFKVHSEVAPGVYWAQGASADGQGGCYWARLSSFDGASFNNIIDNVFQSFPQALQVQIFPGDVGFTSDGCGIWFKVG